MKKILFALMMVAVPWLITGDVMAGQKGQGGGYDPAITYAGGYQPDVLYVKNNGSKIVQALPHFDRLAYVKCSDALDSLSRNGRWQGHLNPDGTCGSYDEPATYTMGNRLNFDDASAEDSN